MDWKNKKREAILLATIAGLSLVAAFASSQFFTLNNWVNILEYNAIIGVMSYGCLVVILSGNIDISVGAVFAATAMTVAAFLTWTGGRYWPLAVLLGVAMGALLSALNAWLIVRLKIPAIVVTLASMNLIRGVLYELTDGAWSERISGPLAGLVNQRLLGLPVSSYLWILTGLLTALFLYKLKVGRDILALGGNPAAAERIGLDLGRVSRNAFLFSGALTGLGAVMSVSQLKSAQPSAGQGYEMNLIAAAVIGGASFSGGEGSILGTFLGVLLMSVVNNSLVLTQTPLYWQQLATGLVIILAVCSSALSLVRGGRKKAQSART